LPRDWPAAIEIAVSEDALSPMAVGFDRARIILPAALAETADDERLQHILAHERAHIERGDLAFLLAERLMLAFFWWSPWLRFALARLRADREEACDDRAANAAGDANAYAQALLDSAAELISSKGRTMQQQAFAVGAFGSASVFAERLRRLAAPGYAAPHRPRARILAAHGAMLAAAALFAFAATPRSSLAGEAKARGLGGDLVEAASDSDDGAVASLIAGGADVNHGVDGDGTALIIASRRGDMDLVELLLANGADPGLGWPGDGNPLIMASSHGHLDVARRLIAAGADVNGYVPEDETPLINAARAGHLDIVQLLVEAGADVNLAKTTRAGERRSPLGMALRGRHADVAAYLRERGARE
jgi:hypothetical protein